MAGETKQDDSIIELTDVVEDDEGMEDILSDDIFSEDEISEDSPVELTDLDAFNDIEMDIEMDVQEIGTQDSDRETVSEDKPAFEGISVSEEQIEAALERVLEKKFAEKIEPLLFDTMERVISQEIQKIKTALLKDMDRIGPF